MDPARRDNSPGADRRRPPRLRHRPRRHEPRGARARGRRGRTDRRARSMSCAFDLDHYGELLDAIAAGGYRDASFQAEPEAGTPLLRHDADPSPRAPPPPPRREREGGTLAGDLPV